MKNFFFIGLFFLIHNSYSFNKHYLCRYGLQRRGPWFSRDDGIPVKIEPTNHSNPSVWPIGNQTKD
jgi:hypothetical protein